jgi:predicted dithiol-disulfide oxidoreductase (DUF899 family)
MTEWNIQHPRIVSRAEWLVARKEHLAQEKEFTGQRDALNAERRKLPMVKIDKDYVFEGRPVRLVCSICSTVARIRPPSRR